jgi:hypothetical protein
MCILQAYKRWKGIELKLTDAANEANDNVRYLTTLERSFEVSRTCVFACARCCFPGELLCLNLQCEHQHAPSVQDNLSMLYA